MCSKIKHILLTACCFTGAGLMTSCNDGFMDRFPETSITEKVFFSSPADLETYTNGMYGLYRCKLFGYSFRQYALPRRYRYL